MKKFALIIDGSTLASVFSSYSLSYKFFRLSLIASSIICCRVSPK
jgi:P-type E1-E2 ATPase